MSEALSAIRDYVDMAISQTREALEVAENTDEELVTLPAFIGQALDVLERIERRVERTIKEQIGRAHV